MRVTTQAIMNRYNRNLSKTLNNLDSSRIKVLTNRNFNSIAEDPAAAAKSFKLRREYNETSEQLENVEDTLSLFDNLAAGALDVSTMLSQDVNADVLSAVNGATSAESRQAYAESLRGVQETIVLTLNAKYGDRFLYGGASTKEAPFELTEEGELTYRGVSLNHWEDLHEEEKQKVEDMLNETLNIDLGFGLEEDNDGVIGSTAFDTAVCGLEIVGYGETEDGISKNAIVLLGQMADELEKEPFDEERFGKLMDQFTETRNDTADYVAELGTKCQFLEDTKTALTTTKDTLNAQILSVEEVDAAAAISNYVWQQYAYNAALKVGTSILSSSFIDFMQ